MSSFSWGTRREGNDGFVVEICDDEEDGYRKEFGPMPPAIVPAFIWGRRRIVEVMQLAKGKLKNDG